MEAGRIVAIGAAGRVGQFALCGVDVIAVADDAAARSAWAALDETVGLAILDVGAAAAIPRDGRGRSRILVAVLP